MSPRVKLSAKYGLNTAILIVLAALIIVLLEAFSYRHYWRKDFTENKRHSLSEQTLNVLAELKEPVMVTVFVSKTRPEYEEARDLFGLYEYHSAQFKVNLVDPDLNPDPELESEIRRYGVPVAFFEAATGRETVTQLTEEQATNALIKVTRGQRKKVCFVSGHGEHALDDIEAAGLSIAAKVLEDKNYQVETLVLMREENVPQDCAVLVVAGPETDLLEPELQAVDRYIAGGGRILFLLDPHAAPSLQPFLGKYGIVVGDNIIIDTSPIGRFFGANELMPIPLMYSSSHPITRNFRSASLFTLARSVSPGEGAGADVAWLAKTGEESWAETDFKTLESGQASFDPKEDVRGPLSLAVAAEIAPAGAGAQEMPDAGKGAIVVFGDSDLFTNSKINLQGDAQLFMNTINWLGQEEALIAIAPKAATFEPVMLTVADARLLYILSVLALPGLALVGGIFMFVRRSRHP